MRHDLIIKISLVAALTACGETSPSRLAIAGGSLAASTSAVAASTVALLESESKKAFCSGVLIGPEQVVTAAHCLTGREVREIGLGFGVQAAPIADVHVSDAYAHPENTGLENDIAVVTLYGELPSTLKPVALATKNFSDLADVTIAGYGETARQRGDFGTLHHVRTKIASYDTANWEFRLVEGEGKGSCDGDSGGPAYLEVNGRLQLMGVTTRGTDIDCNLGNGIFTDVRFFQGWMKCVLESMEAPLESLADDDSRVAC